MAGARSSWAERLVRFLDDGFRVPGTRFRFGADGLLGLLLPSVGDAVTGTGAIALLLLALKERVPTVTLVRMVANILVDTAVGSVPIAGDLFDLFWKSNRRNLTLIEKHRADPSAGPSWADYAVVALGVVAVGASLILPWLALGALACAGFDLPWCGG